MPAPPRLTRHALVRYVLAFALCALIAALALPLRGWLDLANTVMLFLLGVFLSAVRLGRGPAVASAFFSVALFDVFFVPPHLSFTVADAQYLVTFAVMLAIGLITSHLTAQLAERTEAAQARERETRLLYELARDLGAALTVAQGVAILERFLAGLGLEVALLIDQVPAGREGFVAYGDHGLSTAATNCAHAAYRQNVCLTGEGMLFLPFSGTTRVRGVLAISADLHLLPTLPTLRPLLDAVASLTGIAIERLHYAEVAQHSELEAQTEKLRSSILSSISHDLRTPLTSLVGLADTLADTLADPLADPQAALPAESRETAGIIRDQAHAMHRMVANLLEMARLQSGRVNLNKAWQPIDEIVGSSLRMLGELLAERQLVVDLPADLPLVCFDAVLMERVLCNLLENAAKYSAPAATITLTGRIEAIDLAVTVCNAGAGFPAERLDQVFDPFVRGQQETSVPGMGIGLAVCRAIVVAHGGTIRAENRADQACVCFTLPLGTPPALEGELP